MIRQLKHITNVRDLGGTKVANGKHVVYGRLYRGAHLHRIKGKDAHTLRCEMHVTHIFDLRCYGEVANKPDRKPKNIKYHHCPSLTEEQNPAITPKNAVNELKKIMKHGGGAIGYMSDLYKHLITQDIARESHRQILLTLLEDNGAIYWHCTQGKDRTGVAAAVILMALGANREEILIEYLNVRLSLRFKNAVLSTAAGIALLNWEARSTLSVLINAKLPLMNKALDEVERHYGTFDNYIKEGIGLTQEQIDKLREIYLED